jgi:hypothetical protein
MLDPRVPVHRERTSLDELDQVLSSWVWQLWPRGEIAVEVTRAELERPWNVGGALELAIARGVRIHVEPLDEEEPNEAEALGLRLVWKRDGRPDEALSEAISFVRSGHELVWLEIPGADDPKCKIDGGKWLSDPSLEDLFLSVSLGDEAAGFHRIACRAGRAGGVRYVNVTDRGVVLALRSEEQRHSPLEYKAWLGGEADIDDPHLHALLHPVLEDADDPSTVAGMLVLERPRTRAACDAARIVLGRGGTVVLADPEVRFHGVCPELRIVLDRAWRRVDRRPRLSVVIDAATDDLEKEASCGHDEQGCVVTGDTPPRKPPSDAQIAMAHAWCGELMERATGTNDPCGVLAKWSCDSPIGAWSAGIRPLLSVKCQRKLHPRPTDEARAAATSLDSLLALDLVPDREPPLYDNLVTIAFPYVHPDLVAREAILCDHAQRNGGRVLAAWERDRYGASLTSIAERQAWPRATCTSHREVKPLDEEDEGRALPSEIVALFKGQAAERASTRLVARGRFHGPQRSDLAPPAPIRLRAWSSADIISPPSSFPPGVIASTLKTDELDARVLAAGTMVGRGHLLVLGYSPLELFDGVPLTDEASSPQWKDAQPASHTALGPDLLRELYLQTASFSQGSPGSVVGVQETGDGRISIRVIRNANTDAEDLATLELRARGTRVRAPLVDVDVLAQTYSYVLTRADVDSLTANARCVTASVQLRDDLGAPSTIVVCRNEDAADAITLAGEPALRALASFTGGCYADEPCDADAGGGPHELWIAGMVVGLLGLWGSRVHRRLAARTAAASVHAAEEHAQQRYEPPDALAAAEGEWNLHTSTWPRTGAAGGHRPLEPGDRSSAIHPRDLLLMSRGELAILPTVTLRIVEAAPVTEVLVNLGATMRVPKAAPMAPKLRTALQAAEVALSTVWQRRAPASLIGVGIARSEALIERVALHPGRDVVMSAATAVLRTAPADRWPWARKVDVGAIIYISDFMQEDPQALGAWLRDTEAAGARVAGVLVYSPAELAMVEGGTLASSGAWVDRGDWTTAELELAFRRRIQRIEALFDITTGGLMVIDTTTSMEELGARLADRRLSEALR